MTDQEFIDFTMFKPYQKLAVGPDSWDCWGLVVGYFKMVKGVELKMYDHGEIEAGFFSEIDSGQWLEDGAGVVFMAFNAGHPAHCGLLFGDKVLHASGDGGLGQVTMHPLRLIKRKFEDVKIYAYYQAQPIGHNRANQCNAK